jgi:hypothetical protein
MVKRIIAIAFIFAVTSAAWIVLGATILERTGSSDRELSSRVGSTWGTNQAQQAPTAYVYKVVSTARQNVGRTNQPNRRPDVTAPSTIVDPNTPTLAKVTLPLEQTRAKVALDLEHRQKGLLWYSTYTVVFDGVYRFRNNSTDDSITVEFPLPAFQAVYDDLRVTVNGAAVTPEVRNQALDFPVAVKPGDSVTVSVGYKSQGMKDWRYVLGSDVASVRDFQLTMNTTFDDIDFPDNTLSPTEKKQSGKGWELQWRYTNLLSGFQIGMDMPQKLQPGPLAGKIAFFAPVSLLFFFTIIFLLVTIRRIDLHPMNYAFLAAAFFAFHLLLAYLADRISIHLAFVIASVVSIALVVSYLRLVIGPQFAMREAALAQLTYLVLFSYAFFFEGYTGLAITIGSILTLFAAMQLTGRVRWSEIFAAGPPRNDFRHS